MHWMGLHPEPSSRQFNSFCFCSATHRQNYCHVQLQANTNARLDSCNYMHAASHATDDEISSHLRAFVRTITLCCSIGSPDTTDHYTSLQAPCAGDTLYGVLTAFLLRWRAGRARVDMSSHFEMVHSWRSIHADSAKVWQLPDTGESPIKTNQLGTSKKLCNFAFSYIVKISELPG